MTKSYLGVGSEKGGSWQLALLKLQVGNHEPVSYCCVLEAKYPCYFLGLSSRSENMGKKNILIPAPVAGSLTLLGKGQFWPTGPLTLGILWLFYS